MGATPFTNARASLSSLTITSVTTNTAVIIHASIGSPEVHDWEGDKESLVINPWGTFGKLRHREWICDPILEYAHLAGCVSCSMNTESNLHPYTPCNRNE